MCCQGYVKFVAKLYKCYSAGFILLNIIYVPNQAFAFDIKINQKAMYAKDPVDEQNLFVTQVISNVS